MLQNKEQGLGSATGMINQLKDANAQLQQQVEKARADHKEEKARASSLQVTVLFTFLYNQSLIHNTRITKHQFMVFCR